MNRKIIIILALLAVCLLLAGPVSAKEKVKIKITTADYTIGNKGTILIKLVDSKGHPIRSDGKIYYRVTDSDGNYKWTKENYNNNIRLKYEFGKYKVKVKFYGDSKYKKVSKTKKITLKKITFDPYTYYDNHNWGLDQEVDDYFDYNYWNEEIYDDWNDPENEAWNL